MKMGKKVREYKAGDFIFAKVKGYPAWPARVQRMNGKKYFVYFYGTGETANLPPNMIFDYAENKDKFLTKTVKRRDFNDGVKQIEYDFANNIPLEQVIGLAPVVEGVNDTANESTANDTVDESMADTTAADDSLVEENTQNDTGIEDSDETGALVIDEGKQTKSAGRKSAVKTPAKETPKSKEPKTPRGRGKKEEESREELKEDDKKEEEIVSRSGRKIRPKRYIDEQTEENTTLPSPAPKKRRGASPVEKEKENKEKEKDSREKEKEKNIKHFNAITQAELEDLKEPFTPDDPDKENIIIAYLPSGQYIGVKLFQSRPNIFKNEGARLQWDKQAASNALTLKMQLVLCNAESIEIHLNSLVPEKGHITAQSVVAQLVMDLNLTDEEKATLDKDRETEEKKSRVQFLKTEMKLIELDAKIKTCLCLVKADTELCLKLLDELVDLDVKPLMLLKHPTTLETIKRMRAYVGNTPSWELSENAALLFSQHAHKIRKQADSVYNNLKDMFQTPEGLSFWEFFTERVAQFKKATSKLTSDELLELVHEPLEMSVPTSHTMKSAIEAANEEEKEEEEAKKNTPNTPAKTKKAVNNTSSKPPLKRQSSRKQQEEKEKEPNIEENADKNNEQNEAESKDKEKETKENNTNEKETKDKKEKKKDIKERKTSKDDEKSKESKESKEKESKEKDNKEKDSKEKDSKEKENKKEDLTEKESETKEKPPENTEDDADKESVKESKSEEEKKEGSKETEKEKSTDKSDKEDKKEEKDKTEDEPRAKRSRESKKTEPPPRSPTKRKSKF